MSCISSAAAATAVALEVTVPADAAAGDTIEVTLADGRTVFVPVPEGAKTGDVLDFEVVADTGAAPRIGVAATRPAFIPNPRRTREDG